MDFGDVLLDDPDVMFYFQGVFADETESDIRTASTFDTNILDSQPLNLDPESLKQHGTSDRVSDLNFFTKCSEYQDEFLPTAIGQLEAECNTRIGDANAIPVYEYTTSNSYHDCTRTLGQENMKRAIAAHSHPRFHPTAHAGANESSQQHQTFWLSAGDGPLLAAFKAPGQPQPHQSSKDGQLMMYYDSTLQSDPMDLTTLGHVPYEAAIAARPQMDAPFIH